MRLSVFHQGSSAAQSVDPFPAVGAGFEELADARFTVPDGGPWLLRIDDETIPEQDGGWTWRPGFYAGEVGAELVGADGRTVARYLFDVSPDPSKLGRQRFQALQDEVMSEDPALVVGTEPATTILGVEDPLDDSLAALVSFSRLRLYGPGFVCAVKEVSRQPRTVMRTSRESTELHRARRADVQTVRSLARTRAAVLVLDAAKWAGDEAGGPVRVDVPWRVVTVDCAANRCVAAIIMLVRRRVGEVREWIREARARDEPGGARSALDSRLSYRLALLDGLDADLWRLLRSEPWRLVSRPEISAAGLNALAADPRYARIHQLGWKALRRGVGGASPEDRVWLSPTWEIFERWCFVRLARLVRERFRGLAWARQQGGVAAGGALAAWVGRAPGVEVQVLLQPCFRSWDQSMNAPFRSVSRERWPDLVITAEWGEVRRFAVLDAKYRRARSSVLEAMESAHIYRDSLRWQGRRPDLSLLFVPAEPDAGWLTDPSFQEGERVGACVLGAALPPMLHDVLTPPGPGP